VVNLAFILERRGFVSGARESGSRTTAVSASQDFATGACGATVSARALALDVGESMGLGETLGLRPDDLTQPSMMPLIGASAGLSHTDK
jgi:hypothetical protein